MALRGRIGGLRTSALYHPRTITQAARNRFLANFQKQVDPDGTLAPAERTRRALAARRAHFATLAYKSAQVRKQRAARRRKAGGNA